MRKEKLRKFEFVATGLVFSMMLIYVFSARAFASFAGDIYIRVDGSVDPLNAPVATSDNVTYVLTADVSGTLTIQRDNIVFDGAGYTFTGSGSGCGITLWGRSNVTVKDTTMENFYFGISLGASSGNTLSGNTATANNWLGIVLDYYSSGNTVSGNNVTANGALGIQLSDYSDNNTVSGNTVADNQYVYKYGIYLYLSSDNTLSGNNVTNNGFGIYLDDSSNNNVLSGNNVTSNTADGIDILNSSSNNTLLGNTVTANTRWGIFLESSSGNALLGNNVTASTDYGIWLSSSPGNSLSGNNVTSNTWYGIWISSSPDNTLFDNNAANNFYGIWLSHSSNCTLSGNNVTNNRYGICLYSDNDVVSANSATANNQDGIYIYLSSGNVLSGNNVSDNGYGIYLDGSSSNTIFHNRFMNNTNQVYSTGEANVWDSGYPSGGNYWSNHTDRDVFSGPYQNQTGSDGIGDNPYVIDANNTDNYPLMKAFPWSEHDIGITYMGRVYSFNMVTPLKTLVGLRFSMNISTFVMNYGNQTETFSVQVYANDTLVDTFANVTLASRQSATLELSWNTTGLAYGNYTIRAVADNLSGETDTSDNTYTNGMVYVGLPGDMNGDGKVDIRDIAYLAKRFGANPRSSIWNPNADLNDDGKIDIRDIAIAAKHFGEHM